MMASMAGFAVNDALMKTLAQEVPLLQALLVRGAFASLFLLAIVALQRALPARVDVATGIRLAVRVGCEIGATLCFLTALFNMPIANATAILMVTPLAVTLGAVFLGERVGWRRGTAIAVGFAGVLLIVRPGGDGFNAYSLAALAAVVFIVGRDLVTRHVSAAMPSSFVALMTALAILVVGAVPTVAAGWQPVPVGTVLTLAAAAGFLVVGYLFAVMTMRVGDIGFVSPFRYTVLLWAILLGIVVFGEVPDAPTLLGSLIVVGTGLYTLHRERRLARR